VNIILGQVTIYIQEARKSKPKLKVIFPSFDSQKCDSPYVSLLRSFVRQFRGFNRAIQVPYILCMSLEESRRSSKKDERPILRLKRIHKCRQPEPLSDLSSID
jgi:hypothetical protein